MIGKGGGKEVKRRKAETVVVTLLGNDDWTTEAAAIARTAVQCRNDVVVLVLPFVFANNDNEKFVNCVVGHQKREQQRGKDGDDGTARCMRPE